MRTLNHPGPIGRAALQCLHWLHDLRHLLLPVCLTLALPATKPLAEATSREGFERSGQLRLAPRSEATLAWLTGPAVIEEVELKSSGGFRSDRALVLRATWDEAAGPGFLAPWSDLVARDLDGEPVAAPWLESDRSVGVLRFPMEFAESAHLVVLNEAAQPRDISFRIRGRLREPGEPAQYFHAATRFGGAASLEVELDPSARLFGWFTVSRGARPPESAPLRRDVGDGLAPIPLEASTGQRLERRGRAWERRWFSPPPSLGRSVRWRAPEPGSSTTCYWSDEDPALPEPLHRLPAMAHRAPPVPRDPGGIEAELLHPADARAARVVGDADLERRFSGGRALELGPSEEPARFDLLLPKRPAGIYRLQLDARTSPVVLAQFLVEDRPLGSLLRVGDGAVEVGWARLSGGRAALTLLIEAGDRVTLDRVHLEPAERRANVIEAESYAPIQDASTRRDDFRLPVSGRSQLLRTGETPWRLELPIEQPGRYSIRLHLTEGPDRADVQVEHREDVLARFEGRAPVEASAAPLVLPPLALGPDDRTLLLRVVSPDRVVIGLDALGIRDLDRDRWLEQEEPAR